MMTAEAARLVADLEPEDGWFNRETEDKLIDVASALLDQGIHADDVFEHLQTVIGAISAEYGE